MLKTQNRKARSSKKNKGFSLVELIVVIAIMAVLVAVLAPQFTKYIDQSRQSNDAATVSGIVTAAQVGVADLKTYPDLKPGTYTITVKDTETEVTSVTLEDTTLDASIATAAQTEMKEVIENSCGELTTLKRTAHKWKENIVISFTYKSDGTVAISYTPTEFSDYIER